MHGPQRKEILMLSSMRSFPSRRWIVAVLFAAALFLPLPSRAANRIDIAAARALPLGTVVTVKGSVTVPSGAFSSSTFDQGFAIQDRTGGIFVSIATDLDLSVRREVQVTGRLAGNGPRVEPRWVSTASVNESTESLLLQVVGTITGPIVPDPPFGTILSLDDGSGPIRIFACTSTGIDLSGLATGQRLSVTGLGYQFGDYEVDPRFQSDLRRRED